MNESIGQRVTAAILADFASGNGGWHPDEIGDRIDAIVDGERQARIDTAAREIFARDVSTYGSASASADVAYAAAGLLEEARARFIAEQKP